MSKAGGIIGLIAGVFGVFAALATLFIGGLGAAFQANEAHTLIGLGWGGVFFSFLTIIFGAVAIARPKGGGVGLIGSSILGAVLGGTLVAVCMVLSLIGGILAVTGAKNAAAKSEGEEGASKAEGGKTPVWTWGAAVAIAIVIGLAAIGGKSTKPEEDPLVTISNAKPAPLQPTGELYELFALGSKNTDLQRENKLKEITGQVVQWRLPVYEVSRQNDIYKIQTAESGSGVLEGNQVRTFIYLTPRDESERRQIEALKTGDSVSIKGRISGTFMRSLELKPAVLAASKQAAAEPASPPPQAASNTLAVPDLSGLIDQAPEDALDNPALKEKFQALLGAKFDEFKERLNVSSGIQQEGEWLVGAGGMPHLLSIEEAAFAINPKTGDVYAIMLTEGKNMTWFGVKESSKLPAPLRNWYKEHGGT